MCFALISVVTRAPPLLPALCMCVCACCVLARGMAFSSASSANPQASRLEATVPVCGRPRPQGKPDTRCSCAQTPARCPPTPCCVSPYAHRVHRQSGLACRRWKITPVLCEGACACCMCTSYNRPWSVIGSQNTPRHTSPDMQNLNPGLHPQSLEPRRAEHRKQGPRDDRNR